MAASNDLSQVSFARSFTTFNATLNLEELDGTNGFRLDGVTADDNSGDSVSSAGDVNGDGFDDLIIGASGADPKGRDSAGSSYVVFGKASGFRANMNLGSLNGTNGFRLDGVAVIDNSGNSVSSAGDVNGDGFDDLIIGAFLANANGQIGAGSSYVVFGKASGFSASLNLGKLNGANGFRLDGVAALDYSGESVSSAGDVNGDGFDDLIIGASSADPKGRYSGGSSYVVFGKVSGFSAKLRLSNLDGGNGFRLNGAARNDSSGSSVSGAGDVNGDGIDDLIIGAPSANPNGITRAGSSYVVFGKASGFKRKLNLGNLNGSNGFRLEGVERGDFSGVSVSSAGDVNGDGVDDLIIGTSDANSSYVVFGKTSGFRAKVDLGNLNGRNGFRLDGTARPDNFGISVSSAGDVNGDGFDDLIIGAPSADPKDQADAGSSYVMFGKASGFSANMNLSSLDGTNGFRLDGVKAGDFSGFPVSGAGDVNGDRIDDLIIGARDADPNNLAGAGSSYVVFGKTTTQDGFV